MAKRRKSSGTVRITKEISKDLNFVMKESGDDWVTGTLYHAKGGMTSVPLDQLRAGDLAGATSLVSKSSRIVKQGDVAKVLELMFANREEYIKKLDE